MHFTHLLRDLDANERYSELLYSELFRSQDAYMYGCDLSVYGKDGLDFIIAVTLSCLRRYSEWLTSNNHLADYRPTFDILRQDCGLNEDDAQRLLGMLEVRNMRLEHVVRFYNEFPGRHLPGDASPGR